MVTPGRTKSLAVSGVALKILTRKAASELERVVDVFRPVTERETMGVMRACRLELLHVSQGNGKSGRKTYEFIVRLRNSGLICPMNA